MTIFRPCIDLHNGQVKQIVGGTLSTATPSTLRTNYTSTLPSSHYAQLYRASNAVGAHVIMLGPNNEAAAREALAAWPGMMQLGGGITSANAMEWIDAGASKVIVTSYLFCDGAFSQTRLGEIFEALDNDKGKLVIDLSCRRQDDTWFVAMNKWQTITTFELNRDNIRLLEAYCSEFLIHAADNEGLQQGIDETLVQRLAEWCSIPVTYAGGGRQLDDLTKVDELSAGKVDLTIGSALDIFGGQSVKFEDCMSFNQRQQG